MHSGHSSGTLPHTATHCNTLQHTYCDDDDHSHYGCVAACTVVTLLVRCNALQHTATHCNTLQNTATRCNTLQHTASHSNTLQHTVSYCNTLHHTATHSITLQHTATHCNTQYHTATHCVTSLPMLQSIHMGREGETHTVP